ncbi:MAG: aminodeoxychorismate synthase component I [Flavobacteriaceae bacterium]|nr:MAG: aminodeoxychorismate synthase component I [Flavobacteriaceae bacterium]
MKTSPEATFQKMNQFGKEKIPFFFMVDFLKETPLALALDKVNPNEILFDFQGQKNYDLSPEKKTISFEVLDTKSHQNNYQNSFERVMSHLKRGDSFLTNLTGSIPIKLNVDLKTLFFQSQAAFKLWVREEFVCYSPEIFVQIEKGKIYSYPMKGTIDAHLPNAEEKLLKSPKETAEHYTIVDLIRNDLSLVAENVRVEKFRYLQTLSTQTGKKLLAASSKISGDLPQDYPQKIGDIIQMLLPAGSISGAPKHKTLEIISQSETHNRGFYTGVGGIFDGENLNSFVMIRFVEKSEDGSLVYKTGGGITHQSELEKEYQELLQKIYVPTT